MIVLTAKVIYCPTLLKCKVSTFRVLLLATGYHERSFGIVNLDHIALPKNQSSLQDELRACRDDFRLWPSMFKYQGLTEALCPKAEVVQGLKHARQ
jgi:hypothetical protein